MIDWKEIAKQNGLSIEEFKKEIYSIAACIGAMDLDRRGGQRKIKIWITDTRDTVLNAAFDEKLQERLADIAGLSEHYKSKLEELK